MKFVVSSSTMLGCLQTVNKVVTGKGVVPIMENVLLVVKDGCLYATASDSETTIESKIDVVSADQDGAITMPAKLLLDFIKEFPNVPLTFEVDMASSKTIIKTQNAEYSIAGAPADSFPTLSPMDGDSTHFETNCSLFLAGICNTDYALGVEPNRPALSCIQVEMNDDNFTFVATDTHKLALYRRFDAKSETGKYSFMLPKKPAQMLKNVLPNTEDPLMITFNGKMSRIEFGNVIMTCTLAEGRFPNYSVVIPKESPLKVVVSRLDLISAIRRVQIMANQASKLICIEVKDNTMSVSAQNIDYAMSGHETLSCQFDGQPISIGFKSQFLLEMLQIISTENVQIELSDTSRPGAFVPYEAENKNENLLMLLMPIML